MEGSVASKRKIVGSSIVLPPDIIYDVLLRLCVKTLCRFRCVSKSWHTLVSDPGFVQDHHRRSQQNPLLLVATFDCCIPDCTKLHISSLDCESKSHVCEFAVSINARQKKVCNLQSCLDLVCLHDSHNVCICNPATQELIALPQKSSRNHCNYIQSKVGFGYLPSTKEYKVFRRIRSSEHHGYYELLTVGSDSCWRSVGSPPFWTAGAPVFASGAFHMLSKISDIARFDLEKEEWSVTPVPKEIYQELAPDMHLRQVNGLLCIADYCASSFHVNLWFLKDYDNGIWTKEYRIPLPLIQEQCPVFLRPLAVEADGRILMVEACSGGKLQCYDPVSKSFQQIQTAKSFSGFNISYYVESFTSLGERIM